MGALRIAACSCWGKECSWANARGITLVLRARSQRDLTRRKGSRRGGARGWEDKMTSRRLPQDHPSGSGHTMAHLKALNVRNAISQQNGSKTAQMRQCWSETVKNGCLRRRMGGWARSGPKPQNGNRCWAGRMKRARLPPCRCCMGERGVKEPEKAARTVGEAALPLF